MNGYYKWTSTTFHLGPSAAEKLFAVSTKGGWFDSSPPISLHSGPSAKDPVLGKAKGIGKWSTMETTVTVPRGMTPANPDRDTHTTVAMKYTSWKDAHYTFSTRVPPVPGSKEPPQLETFEWRSTSGTEAKEISGGSWSSGYKLVRMTGGPAGEGGARKVRDVGFTSDGREIVAIIVHNSSWSLSKGMRFAFMGTGLTGLFGEEWEITALVTGLQLWILDVLTATASS
ncbi:uncharacterized protein DNG_09890 [Cephalotrichum gorgonifer]|uniref:Uncharacterized protein n=1 Tax=Cephalotrichum gorgonifer TaxID=2041049 RepID=A0AAE8N6J9_9PEZI|nr:uncharacterized protein DNG_09890 [Cephalotrichum gorgonifer]